MMDECNIMALKFANDYAKDREISPEKILEIATLYLAWLRGNKIADPEPIDIGKFLNPY